MIIYRVVIGAEEFVFVDAQDHITDTQTGLFTSKSIYPFKNQRFNRIETTHTRTKINWIKHEIYLFGYALRLDVRDENTATHISMPTFDDHDTQSLSTLYFKHPRNINTFIMILILSKNKKKSEFN